MPIFSSFILARYDEARAVSETELLSLDQMRYNRDTAPSGGAGVPPPPPAPSVPPPPPPAPGTHGPPAGPRI